MYSNGLILPANSFVGIGGEPFLLSPCLSGSSFSGKRKRPLPTPVLLTLLLTNHSLYHYLGFLELFLDWSYYSNALFHDGVMGSERLSVPHSFLLVFSWVFGSPTPVSSLAAIFSSD